MGNQAELIERVNKLEEKIAFLEEQIEMILSEKLGDDFKETIFFDGMDEGIRQDILSNIKQR